MCSNCIIIGFIVTTAAVVATTVIIAWIFPKEDSIEPKQNKKQIPIFAANLIAFHSIAS